MENFSKLLPKYFKSIVIPKSIENIIFSDESINFLGRSFNVNTKDVIIPPEIHQVHIFSGPICGSTFFERYIQTDYETNVVIKVSINFNEITKLLRPFGFLIKKQKSKVMDEFLESTEKAIKNDT